MDEILVHISASTTRRNDDIYRSLANAYLEFEPYQARDDEAQREREDQGGATTSAEGGFASTMTNPKPTPSDIPPSFSSRDSYGSFPSRISPGHYGSVLNYSMPDDSLMIAQPMEETSRLEQLEQIQSNWRRQTRSKMTVSSNQITSHDLTSSLMAVDTAFIEDSQFAIAAMGSQLHDPTTESADETSEDDSIYMSHKNSTGLIDIPSSEMSGLGLETEYEQMTRVTSSSHRSPSPADTTYVSHNATQSFRSNNEESLSTPLPDFQDLPFEVFAPPPAISMDSPNQLPSQITSYLQALRQQNNQRFNPSRSARALKTDERGYWLVESGKWSRRAQLELWTSLRNHIQRGDLGWGITLHRASSYSAIDQIKVYCWGEIVEHIWLCLWVFSGGKITGSGCRWFDAGDNVVIQAD